MKLAAAVLMTALSAAPAFAQSSRPSINLTPDKPGMTEEQVEKQEKLDRQYKAAIGQTPAQKTADPWGNVRAVEKPAPAKTAKPATPR